MLKISEKLREAARSDGFVSAEIMVIDTVLNTPLPMGPLEWDQVELLISYESEEALANAKSLMEQAQDAEIDAEAQIDLVLKIYDIAKKGLVPFIKEHNLSVDVMVSNQPLIFSALTARQWDLINFILNNEKKININHLELVGTLLHEVTLHLLTFISNELEIQQELEQNPDNEDLIMMLEECNKSYPEFFSILRRILELGADPMLKNNNGQSSLDLLSQFEQKDNQKFEEIRLIFQNAILERETSNIINFAAASNNEEDNDKKKESRSKWVNSVGRFFQNEKIYSDLSPVFSASKDVINITI